MPEIDQLTVDWQHFLELGCRNAQGVHNFMLVRFGSTEIRRLGRMTTRVHDRRLAMDGSTRLWEWDGKGRGR